MAVGCRIKLPPSLRHRRVRPAVKDRRVPLDSVRQLHPCRAEATVDWIHPNKTQPSISLTQETSKLRKELAQIIISDVISGQTIKEILMEFLPGVLNTLRVDVVYEFKGNSFLATLCSEEEATKASKNGDMSLPSRLVPCMFTISPWTAEVGSVGAASGKG